MNADEARKASVVAAAQALREERLAGGIALLVSAGYGLMLSKASLVADGVVEVTIMDLVGEQREVGTATAPHVSRALLKAMKPMLEHAGKRPRLQGITGGKGKPPKGEEFTARTEVLEPEKLVVTEVDHEAREITVAGEHDGALNEHQREAPELAGLYNADRVILDDRLAADEFYGFGKRPA